MAARTDPDFIIKSRTDVLATHGVTEAIRRLKADERPSRLYGCEVWRDLDWLPDAEKVAFDLSARLGLCPPADAERVRRHLGAVGLPMRLRSIGGDNRRQWDAGRLIDGATGAHLWADRFDGALEDVFDLQDKISEQVVGAIAPAVEGAEIERAVRAVVEELDLGRVVGFEQYDVFLDKPAPLVPRALRLEVPERLA